MKLYKAFLTVATCAVLLFAGACDSISEYNEDPNNPTEVPENLILPGVLSNFSYEIIANDAVRIPAHWIQQLAWTGDHPSTTTYDVDEADVNNLWEFFAYTDVMNTARGLSEQAEENGNLAYAGISKIIQAWTLAILTDLYGDIPLSEAFDPTNFTPAYDTQEEIYNNGVFPLLNEAIQDLQEPEGLKPGRDDLLYGGDLGKWERLAYSLLGRFHMRLSEAPGYDRSTQAQAALQALENGFESIADDADYAYYATADAENPWYQLAIGNEWDTRDQLNAYYVDLLKDMDDPRLPIHARPVGAVDQDGVVEGFDPDEIVYEGAVAGTSPGADDASSIGAYFSAADAPLTWIDYPSTQFVRAEALLYTSGAAAAQPVFEEAVEADMEKLGVPADEIAAYLASLPALTADNALEQIIVQKYIANFLNLEAYNDFRRTGYPALQPLDPEVLPDARLDIVPLRFPYPSSELARNAASIPDYVPLGFDAMRVPVWWDTTLPDEGVIENPTQ